MIAWQCSSQDRIVMIWLIRLSIIPVTILFLAFFASALVVTQIDSRLGSSGFYQNQMEKADVYNFVYDEALPTKLEEVDRDDESNSIPVEVSEIDAEIVSAVRKVLPPEWLEEQFEEATDAMIPYFLGSKDKFTYTLPLNERIDMAVEVFKSDIIHGKAFENIYEDMISYASDKVIENLDRLPYSLTISKSAAEESLKIALTEEWMASQLESAIDSIKPYVVDESKHFSVSLNMSEVVDEITAAAIELTSGEETYEYLLDKLITPTIEENINTIVDLPFDIALPLDDITASIKQAMPESWINERLEEVGDDVAAYARGEIDTIEITVDLNDRKASARDVMTAVADEMLEDAFLLLPECSSSHFLSSIQNLAYGQLPVCRPVSISYELFKETLNMESVVARAIDELILEKLPDEWVFSDAEFRESLGPENQDFLETAREYVANGWIFDDEDLMEEIDPSDKDTFNDLRFYLGNGYTIDEKDIRENISDSEEDRESFDDTRDIVDTARTWLWTLWIIPIILLIAIGFIYGRKWKERFIWALAVLFVTSLILCITTQVVHSCVVDASIEDAFDDHDVEGFELLLLEKGEEVAENSAGSIASAIKNVTIWIMVLSGLILAVLIFTALTGMGISDIIEWIKIRFQREPDTPLSPPVPESLDTPESPAEEMQSRL